MLSTCGDKRVDKTYLEVYLGTFIQVGSEKAYGRRCPLHLGLESRSRAAPESTAFLGVNNYVRHERGKSQSKRPEMREGLGMRLVNQKVDYAEPCDP